MTQANNHIPQGMHSITPYLVVTGAAKAIEFYKKAFNATELERHGMPDSDMIMHAKLKIGDSVIMLSDEFPDTGCGVSSPTTLKNTTFMLHLYVPDADRAFEQAIKAGSKEQMPLSDTFWGERYGQIVDPFGHVWSISTLKEVLTDQEVEERAAQFFASQQ